MTPTTPNPADTLRTLADGPVLSKGAADAAELVLVRTRVREAADEMHEMEKTLVDCGMMIRMFCSKHKDSPLRDGAHDFLRRKGLQGSVLRSASPPPAEPDERTVGQEIDDDTFQYGNGPVQQCISGFGRDAVDSIMEAASTLQATNWNQLRPSVEWHLGVLVRLSRSFNGGLQRANRELTRLREENGRLREALERILGWDCLNPPRRELLEDLPWLRRLVETALRPPTTQQEATQ